MQNIIEGINNSESEAFDVYPSGNDETSGCSLVETLEKNFAVLSLEARQVAKIDSELESKLHSFNDLSNSITSKLQSLVKLSELRFGDKEEIKQFVEQATLSWIRANKQMVKRYAGIHVASHTCAGAPLSVLLAKKKKEAAAIKVSLQIGSVIYDQDYVSRGFRIYEEICRVLESMDRCDDKIQQYMVISKTTPYLFELATSIDKFVANTNLSPLTNAPDNSIEDLAGIFGLVSQLLTGELLGLEATNPRQILSENAPRKPVFITLNRASSNKRKLEAPKSTKSKIPRSSSFPPTGKSK